MNALASGLFRVLEGLPATVLLLMIKLTALLAAAWLLNAVLARANPRWRVLLWRAVPVAFVALAILALFPPLFSVRLVAGRPWAQLAGFHSPAIVAAADDRGRLAAVDLQVNLSQAPRRLAFPGDAPTVRAPIQSQAIVGYHRPADNRQKGELPGRSAQPAGTPRSQDKPHCERPPPGRAIWFLAGVANMRHAPLVAGLGTVWATGVLAGLVWAMIGLERLARIRQRAVPAPGWMIVEAARVALAFRLGRDFDLRLTEDLQVPSLARLGRPMILLPARHCSVEFRDELPAVLAHELAHLKGGDRLANAVLHWLSILLWFHPLMWKVRVAHADACDGVSDAVAAGYVGSAAHYGRSLAQLTLRITDPGVAGSLALVHTACVRRRIEALRRHVYRADLPRLHAAFAVTLAAVLVTALGGMAVR